MKVINKGLPKKTFGDLKVGALFTSDHDKEIYMKVEASDDDNCIGMEGDVVGVGGFAEKATVVIEYEGTLEVNPK